MRSLTPSPGPPRPARGFRIGPARGLRPPPHPHRTPAAPPHPAAAGPGRSAAGRGPRARGCGSRHAGRGAAGPAAATAELRGTAAANGAPGRAPEPPTRPHSGRRRPMGRRGGLRPQPIAGGVREPTVGGRRGVAAEGALRQGGGAHARTPLAPPREANLCAALRQSALPAPRRIFLRGPTRRLKTAPRRVLLSVRTPSSDCRSCSEPRAPDRTAQPHGAGRAAKRDSRCTVSVASTPLQPPPAP